MSNDIQRVLVPVSFPGGGIRTYMIYNLKPLHQAGFRFTFLSRKGETFDNFKKDFADCEGTEFVEAVSGSALAFISAICRELKSGRYSLIHSQGLQAGTLTEISRFAGRLKPLVRKVPSIITLHDVIVPQNDIPGKFRWLKKKIISFFTRRASVIIPVSNDCAENHLALFPAWKRGLVTVKVIVNGIAIKSGTLKRPVSGKTIFAGFFGRFMPQKGFDILLDALELLADSIGGTSAADNICVLATLDRHGYTNETLKRVENSPVLKQMVQFIEAVPDIMPLFEKIDVLIMPSRWEACPLLPAEAMAAGVPVIGSDALGLREMLAGTPALQFNLEDGQVRSLTNCILEFINNASEYKRLAADYTAIAKERFDVKKSADELLAIYRELT